MRNRRSRPTRRWRNYALVLEKDSRRARGNWIVLLGIIMAVAPLAFYLLQQMQFVQVRYRIERIRAQHERFVEAEQQYRVERASLECLSRVEARARKLGLVHPPPDHVVVVLRTGPPALGNLMARAPDNR